MKSNANFLKSCRSFNLSSIAILSIAGLFISNFAFLSAHVEGENLHFNQSYSKMIVDSENPFSVQTEKHLYTPGDDVQINGIIWSGLIAELGGVNQVTLQILDDKDMVLNTTKTQVNSDGQYNADIFLPNDAGQGKYTIDAKINVNEDVLGSMTLKTQASTQSSSKFLVANPNSFSLNATGTNFDVVIASNSDVSDLQFNEQAKILTFTVSGEAGTNGVVDIIIPKSLLSGDISVTIDGQAMSQDNIIKTADTQDETALEINYHHSMHTIEITGTNAVPEFPMSIIVMSVAISFLVIFVSTRQRLKYL